MEKFRFKLGFDFAMNYACGSLWLFFINPFNCLLIGEGSQHLSVLVQQVQLDCLLILYFLHASCSEQERSSLWDGLLHDRSNRDIPWMMVRDFNLILDQTEKYGVRPFNLLLQ